MVICEECLAESERPQDALRNANGRRCFVKGEVRNVTFDEIKALGRDKFITDTKEKKSVDMKKEIPIQKREEYF